MEGWGVEGWALPVSPYRTCLLPPILEAAWARLGREPHFPDPTKSNPSGEREGLLAFPSFTNEETEAAEDQNPGSLTSD